MGRQIVINLVANAVAGADLQRLKPVEHVKLGERDAGDAGDSGRLADEDGIEPTAAALAASDGAKFMAAFPKPLAGGVFQFGRERAGADTCGVCLYDTEHEAHRGGAEA